MAVVAALENIKLENLEDNATELDIQLVENNIIPYQERIKKIDSLKLSFNRLSYTQKIGQNFSASVLLAPISQDAAIRADLDMLKVYSDLKDRFFASKIKKSK